MKTNTIDNSQDTNQEIDPVAVLATRARHGLPVSVNHRRGRAWLARGGAVALGAASFAFLALWALGMA